MWLPVAMLKAEYRTHDTILCYINKAICSLHIACWIEKRRFKIKSNVTYSNGCVFVIIVN